MAMDLLIKYNDKTESDLLGHNKMWLMCPYVIQTEVLQEDAQSDPHKYET